MRPRPQAGCTFPAGWVDRITFRCAAEVACLYEPMEFAKVCVPGLSAATSSSTRCDRAMTSPASALRAGSDQSHRTPVSLPGKAPRVASCSLDNKTAKSFSDELIQPPSFSKVASSAATSAQSDEERPNVWASAARTPASVDTLGQAFDNTSRRKDGDQLTEEVEAASAEEAEAVALAAAEAAGADMVAVEWTARRRI
jgi:hypothetical protein